MINQRLKVILSNIERGKGFVDVGTDHGYLLVEAAKSGYSGNIIGTDINKDPLEKARRNTCSLNRKVDLFLCDGLDMIPPDSIDTIVIAGMGGDNICGILDRTPWLFNNKYKLILQPMSKSEVLRYWLNNNGFNITQETVVNDDGTLYYIICAGLGERQDFSLLDIYTGKKELQTDIALYEESRQSFVRHIEKIIEGLKTSDNRVKIDYYSSIIRG